MNKLPLAAALLLTAVVSATAQDSRAVAFTRARIVTVSGETYEQGTLVIRNGKIEAVGVGIAVPAGARVIDAAGKTILPGLVSARSAAGLQAQAQPTMDEGRGGRRGRANPMPAPAAGAQNKAATKVVEGLYGKQDVFGELLRRGVTSLALTPVGNGFPGLGALLRPDGKTTEQLTVDDDAFLLIGMAREASTKKLLKESFEKAQKIVEERKKPPEKPAAAPATEAAKPGAAPSPTEPPKTGEPPKPEPPKPEEKKDTAAAEKPAAPARQAPKDANLEVIADLLEGKVRAMIEIDSAADLLHWQDAVADGIKFPRAIAVPRHDTIAGTVDHVIEQLKSMQCPVLLQPDLSTRPRSRYLIHPARQLHEAGIEVGFILGDNANTVRMLFFRLIELVRAGLPADVALRGVTLVPAKALGIDKTVGSLDVGKDANLLIFRGDPLSAAGAIDSVWLLGQEVPPQP